MGRGMGTRMERVWDRDADRSLLPPRAPSSPAMSSAGAQAAAPTSLSPPCPRPLGLLWPLTPGPPQQRGDPPEPGALQGQDRGQIHPRAGTLGARGSVPGAGKPHPLGCSRVLPPCSPPRPCYFWCREAPADSWLLRDGQSRPECRLSPGSLRLAWISTHIPAAGAAGLTPPDTGPIAGSPTSRGTRGRGAVPCRKARDGDKGQSPPRGLQTQATGGGGGPLRVSPHPAWVLRAVGGEAGHCPRCPQGCWSPPDPQGPIPGSAHGVRWGHSQGGTGGAEHPHGVGCWRVRQTGSSLGTRPRAEDGQSPHPVSLSPFLAEPDGHGCPRSTVCATAPPIHRSPLTQPQPPPKTEHVAPRMSSAPSPGCPGGGQGTQPGAAEFPPGSGPCGGAVTVPAGKVPVAGA